MLNEVTSVQQQLRAIWIAIRDLQDKINELERELGPEED